MKFYAQTRADTCALAARLAQKLVGGEIILLRGALGAGKTTFTKGLAAALGVTDTVTSPTFTFMKHYSGRLELYHFDMYRAEDADELYELGLDDYIYAGGVCVVEWNKFTDLPKAVEINIEVLPDGAREIEILGADI